MSTDNPELLKAPEEVQSEDVLSQLNKTVAVKISNSTRQVVDAVVDQFVTLEVTRRTDLLFKAIEDCNKQRNEFKKIKPDVQSFDADGKLISESWSKTKVEERKKAIEAIKKKEKVIEKALAGDFSLLLNG